MPVVTTTSGFLRNCMGSAVSICGFARFLYFCRMELISGAVLACLW